jgi:aminoglycoside phosphotransferase (APT) family kinase protein
MPEAIIQPHAMPLSADLIASLTSAFATQTGGAGPSDVIFHGQHSNDVAELRFDDGRTLMVKRGRYDWTAPRFRASRLAAELLNEQAGVVAPAPLPIPPDLHSQPLEAYWRVELPTLQELWPGLGQDERATVLRSWGELVARMHRVRVSGHGPLAEMQEGVDFEVFVGADLGHRLYPAMAAQWTEGIEILERVRSTIPAVAERVADGGCILLHYDLHMGNVLCDATDEGVRCVGFIDLETAFGGPPEADLAIIEVHHGPHFSQPLEGEWFQHIEDGYGRALDPVVMAFFRSYHLLNMGFYSALVGHAEHAHVVARAASREADGLRSLLAAA